jgi:hypothetical protein
MRNASWFGQSVELVFDVSMWGHFLVVPNGWMKVTLVKLDEAQGKLGCSLRPVKLFERFGQACGT